MNTVVDVGLIMYQKSMVFLQFVGLVGLRIKLVLNNLFMHRTTKIANNLYMFGVHTKL